MSEQLRNYVKKAAAPGRSRRGELPSGHRGTSLSVPLVQRMNILGPHGVSQEAQLCMGECPVTHLFPTLCYPMDCSLPGSSVHEIFQVRILERVANFLPSSGASLPRDGACVFGIMHWQADSLPPHQLESPVVHTAFQL
ncbi:unnamed protein product [Rangifer tarandus platyrhynchus]|uniref:Uncharacterized protein n=1 Tax=Rangifer tarandus platyrhynchus TaxID=3082113 RepID=A0AC59ZN08_RANTA